MIGPIVIQGRKPDNLVNLKSMSTGAMLVMRRPPTVRSRETRICWYVNCQAQMLLNDAPFVSVPAHPAAQDQSPSDADNLLLAPLSTLPRVVAVVQFPVMVLSWRFEFYAEDPEHPDAKAHVWLEPTHHQHTSCGLFLAPYRGL